MILPFLAPPAVAAWKGVRWGLAIAGLQLILPLLASFGIPPIRDPYTGTVWMICTVAGILVIGMQAVAGRLLRVRDGK